MNKRYYLPGILCKLLEPDNGYQVGSVNEESIIYYRFDSSNSYIYSKNIKDKLFRIEDFSEIQDIYAIKGVDTGTLYTVSGRFFDVSIYYDHDFSELEKLIEYCCIEEQDRGTLIEYFIKTKEIDNRNLAFLINYTEDIIKKKKQMELLINKINESIQ